MATGGYRGSGASTTTDFLEEWKAKREKMRAKQAPPAGGLGTAAGDGKASGGAVAAAAATPEVNNNSSSSSGGGGMNCVALARAAPKEPQSPSPAGSRGGGAEPVGGKGGAAPGSPEEDKAAAKGKGSSGPSARKGKGQIEKRKLREKRRSTGVVNIPATESLDEYDDDEAGQKERKREDAITQQNTVQNESASTDPSYIIQETSRTISNRFKSTTNPPDDEVSNRYPRPADRAGYNRYNRDGNSSGNLVPSNTLEKKIEDLEKELAKERQENLRLVRIAQDKEELIGKLKEEIDLLNRDLDDIEDENEQLKQENKTLLKVVGQLTR